MKVNACLDWILALNPKQNTAVISFFTMIFYMVFQPDVLRLLPNITFFDDMLIGELTGQTYGIMSYKTNVGHRVLNKTFKVS